MIKKLLATAALGSALSIFAPTAVFAADHDDHRDHRQAERREVREHRHRRDRDRDHDRDARYSRGSYDHDGRWHDRGW
jgi:hypothetical protein